jgi:hypothetical protein
MKSPLYARAKVFKHLEAAQALAVEMKDGDVLLNESLCPAFHRTRVGQQFVSNDI